MIKYHSTFTGWLIHKRKIEKTKNKLVLKSTDKDSLITDYSDSIYNTGNNRKQPFPPDELSQEFTINNIQNNIQNWSKELEQRYVGGRRNCDMYSIITQWDIYSQHINIPLTYEIAQYLSTIQITLGGSFFEYDVDTLLKTFPSVNGLKAFAHHRIANEEELLKCLDDDDIIDALLRPDYNSNTDLIEWITDSFFSDYSIQDYLDIVNTLKDWGEFKYFDFYPDYNLISESLLWPYTFSKYSK